MPVRELDYLVGETWKETDRRCPVQRPLLPALFRSTLQVGLYPSSIFAATDRHYYRTQVTPSQYTEELALNMDRTP